MLTQPLSAYKQVRIDVVCRSSLRTHDRFHSFIRRDGRDISGVNEPNPFSPAQIDPLVHSIEYAVIPLRHQLCYEAPILADYTFAFVARSTINEDQFNRCILCKRLKLRQCLGKQRGRIVVHSYYRKGHAVSFGIWAQPSRLIFRDARPRWSTAKGRSVLLFIHGNGYQHLYYSIQVVTAVVPFVRTGFSGF